MDRARQGRRVSAYRQNQDGSYGPAEPMGWREEHNLFQRLILWLRRRPHCSDEAHQVLMRTCPICGERASRVTHRLDAPPLYEPCGHNPLMNLRKDQ